MAMASPTEPSASASRPRTKSRVTHEFPCPTCSNVFSRIDHLSRHLRSHSVEKDFFCSICNKGFTRADSLNRHIQSHKGDPNNNLSTHRNTLARVPNACQKCAASKLRCDGGQPCGRCRDKDFHCAYMKRIRRRVKEVPMPSAPDQLYSLGSDDTPTTPESPHMQTDMLNVDTMQSLDVRALDTLSMAAIQASSTPATSNGINLQLVQGEAFMQANTPISTRPFSSQSKEPNGNIHVSLHDADDYGQDFNQLPLLTSNVTDGMDNNWRTDHAVNHTPFNDHHSEGLDDRQSDASNFGTMDFHSLWDNTFDITDWTTLEYAFHSDVPAPYTHFDHSHHSSFGQQQVRSLSVFDNVRTSNSLAPPNSYDITVPYNPEQSYGTQGAEDSPQLQNSGNDASISRINHSMNVSDPPPMNDERYGEKVLPSNINSKHDSKVQQVQWPTDWDPDKSDNILSFPELGLTPREAFDAENFSHVPPVPLHVYESIVLSISETSKHQTFFRPFTDSPPPSIEAFNCFVQLYFEYFQPIFPLLHQPTFDPGKVPWVLVLAVAAIGCRYSKVKELAKCDTTLEELLRRAIQHSIERDNSVSRKLWLSQALVLNMLGMLYSGDKRLLELALVEKGGMVTICSRNNCFKQASQINSINENLTGRSLESAWKIWSREESHRRLGFFCWLLDCQLPLYFDTNPAMGMHEVQQQLPCKEAVWEAADGESWKSIYLQNKTLGSTLNLQAALHCLSSQVELSPTIGDFGRLILVHAVYMTTWEMRQQAKNPLLQRAPFLPAKSAFAAWQEIAISTLNVLLSDDHDNTRTSVLRLNLRAHVHHVALLVHVPLSTLLTYARSQVANHDIPKAQQELSAWMEEDSGRTARHAVIHACILFSLIRAHPCRGLHEPMALLIATLTLWAFHQLSQQQKHPEATSQRQVTVRLDKVQKAEAALPWIENGAQLRGYLTDVGNICGHGAGMRLLQLSCRALVAMDAWSLSQGFLHVLSTLQVRLTESNSG